MKKIEQKAGGLKRKVRDRMRSVRKRVLAIALSTRYLGAEGEARRKKQYRELLSLTRKTVNQAQRLLEEVKEGPRARRIPLRSLVESLATMMGRVQQVVKQTRLRIFAGVTKSQEKIVSVFESHTEIIRKGKASKPTEFGKLVKIQESENQIISHFEVFAERPSDRQLLVPSIEVHQRRLAGFQLGWLRMRGSTRSRMKKLLAPGECDGCRCRIRRRRVRNANDFIGSAGFVVDNGGAPDARAASAR